MSLAMRVVFPVVMFFIIASIFVGCASKPVIMVNCQKASDPFYICEKP